MLRVSTFLSLSIAYSAMACANPVQYAINTQKTSVEVFWTLAGHAISHAQLTHITGAITFDSNKDFDDKIVVNIPLYSLNAQNILLTNELKSGTFFDEAHFPLAHFTSTRVIDIGGGHYRVLGSLQIKNIQRPVILDAEIVPDNHLNALKRGMSLHANTTISRSAFGMDSYLLLVADPIKIDINIEASMS
ncbi:hypothetical protein GA565_10975 [Rouxiella sp. S1S-2]|uniref:YceI family protein n=1 Tax=Rouxiella sp. S1S-2 TaxID=2653856 RepID=UPI001264F05C|nr:YceI family protein [Rouxiella sp. S1S-2]KAB7896463.1 hypothetical protein GA565_10975 [Rouxiella sp. S1S-2]